MATDFKRKYISNIWTICGGWETIGPCTQSETKFWSMYIWLVVSTPLKNISQLG